MISSGVNACFGGWSKKETIEPRVLPVLSKNRPIVEETIKPNTVNKQSAAVHRGVVFHIHANHTFAVLRIFKSLCMSFYKLTNASFLKNIKP